MPGICTEEFQRIVRKNPQGKNIALMENKMLKPSAGFSEGASSS